MVELGGLTVPAIARGDLIEMKHRSSFFGNDEAAKARDRADLDVLEARFV
jgi:hypothetical protein